ncbi:hypothetical protein BUALT_Bualt02G0068100 [Buddleja alternifolia]|uniref:Protein kinase domain-containing protein n=1 Tax=Buddleja alternifolia TaxID=168488 RepID=A0AAV6Y4S1_9LAMI|nr:hypothetical protein BUALT_Bualt02G0068100 [Buddleja alternifolia]
MDHLSPISVSGRCWLLLLLLIIVMFPMSESVQSDIDCLRSIKESLQDPLDKLSTWQFNDIRAQTFYYNYTCSFNGVECWNNDENRIISIQLSDMGLIGEFPQGIANCSSLQGLDLSNNHLYGSIPSHISDMMPFVISLDLSSNNFSGQIPVGIADFSYLNVLKLNNNFFSGQIPQQLVYLQRLTSFRVANNLLSGPVPAFPNSLTFPPEIYANNTGLCGYPLDPCESGGESERDAFVSGLLVGWAVFFALSLVVGWFIPLDKLTINFIKRRWVMMTPRLQSLLSSHRTDNTMISMLERFATRMSFSELSEATDNFSENNVIAIGETGTTYKGTLTNDRCLAIKRLFHSTNLEHQFQSEIETLGRFRHKTLVQLIGFCHEFTDRFIIYKFMPNGSLHHCLFSSNINMEWPLRMRIAVGIAKGIAWLHQNRIVHRGISSKCVLLDENFDPKISEFGKATISLNGEFSLPSCYEEDIYAFGMVLLELITGKKHEEFINSSEGGDMFELISKLQATGEYDDGMCCFLRIAGKCVECDPGNWPSMVQVYQMLIGTTRREDSDTKNEIQFAD